MDFIADGFSEALELILSGDGTTFHAIGVSVGCTLVAVTLAAIVAIPFGAWLGLYRPRSRIRVVLIRFGMSVPTVIIGLLVFALLSRQGLLGGLDLLYTRTAIILGETLLAFPLLASLAHGFSRTLPPVVLETARTLGATTGQSLRRALGECRPALVGALLAAFGRCFTELGIAITVGGNLASKTRTLPAAIQLELSRGDFARALAPGILLLVIAGLITVLSYKLAGERRR